MEVKNDRKDEGETDGTGCSKRIWHGNERRNLDIIYYWGD